MEVRRFQCDDLCWFGLDKDLFGTTFEADVESFADPYGLGHGRLEKPAKGTGTPKVEHFRYW